MAALICGGAELILNVLTNYPGGLKKVIPFSTHRKMDVGLAAMIATMPELFETASLNRPERPAYGCS